MQEQLHVQPEEVELLLDGDEGFASHPLRKHLEACADCRATLERARAVNTLIERLPHVPPTAGFADRVMARVEVFEPWYVTLGDTVRQFIPRQGPWRVAASLGVGGAALSITALALWVALRLDLAVYALQLAGTRIQAAAVNVASNAVASLFGESALVAVRDGGIPAVAIGATLLLGALAAATLGLRRLLVSARER